jgi:hypothetical protein
VIFAQIKEDGVCRKMIDRGPFSTASAVNDTFAWLNPYQNRFMLVNQNDGEGMAS